MRFYFALITWSGCPYSLILFRVSILFSLLSIVIWKEECLIFFGTKLNYSGAHNAI